ncbi:MAG: hypothetical protein ACRCTE_04550 [Cellulosilyticaceae bacterium]
MKKTKFMVGALVLSMGVLGTGYAYWTDVLTVGTTVSTGKFEMAFNTEEDGINDNSEYVESTILEPMDKGFSVEIKDVYPGAQANYYINIKNEGTIPAKVEEVKVTFEGSQELANELKFNVKYRNSNTFTVKGSELEKKLNQICKDEKNIAIGEEVKLDMWLGVPENLSQDFQKGNGKDHVKMDVEIIYTQYNAQ